MPKNFLLNFAASIVAILFVGLATLAWERASDGSLVKALGGAVIADIKQQCTGHPVEDFEPYAQCREGTYELLRWCSGDCNDDDAKMTICCNQ